MLEWIDWTWVAYTVAALIFFIGLSKGFENIKYQLQQIHGAMYSAGFNPDFEVEQELSVLRDQNLELQKSLESILHELRMIRMDTESISGLGKTEFADDED